MTTKVTKREMYEVIRAIAEGSDRNSEVTDEMIVEFCNKEIASLEAKAVKAKERAEQRKAEGDELTEAVYTALNDEYQPIATIAEKVIADNEEATVGKVQYRLKVLVDTGRAEKQEITVENNGEKSKKMGYRAL